MGNGSGAFFISWELWQQMTFVLGCGIVVVFIIGLVKLTWRNNIMRKQEIMDEEKRSRLSDMRRLGLETKKGGLDVPFGIRAIQTGIEVDGIWISRPSTPVPNASTTKLTAATTLADTNDPSLATGMVKIMVAEPQQLSPSAVDNAGPNSHHVPSGLSLPTGMRGGAASQGSNGNLSPPSRKKSHRARSESVVNEDALSMLEGRQGRPGVQTYAPKPAGPMSAQQQQYQQQLRQQQQQQRQQTQQQSTKSILRQSESSADSYATSPTYSSHLHSPLGPSGVAAPIGLSPYGTAHSSGYAAVPAQSPARTPNADIMWNPFETSSVRSTPTMMSTPHMAGPNYSETQLPLLQQQQSHGQYQQYSDAGPSKPAPTFGPGDLHVNRKSRKVNAGFEVLPAGTFGVPHEFILSPNPAEARASEEQDHGNNRLSRISQKLIKKSLSQRTGIAH